MVKDTIRIPVGTQLVGEAWSTIAGKGAKFADEDNPRPVVQVGTKGDVGVVEINDVLFTTIGGEVDKSDPY